ncbi:hypothetical protein [Halomarina litorea]|uniref:hypothetical protein n=1 Tax=Halomarina litorea TaxID=2961595 RepID=UPI0020C43479|nr:hypothetical protein [Halomarina sp. BCD28]
MADTDHASPDPGIDHPDPRVDPEFVRRVGEDRPLYLVGTVHGHPASAYRARAVAAAVRPGVLALELSPTALPAFRAGRSDDEMSAAMAGAPGARHVGIDAVDGPFLTSLARRLVAERVDRGTVCTVVRNLTGVVRRSLEHRVRGRTPAVEPEATYDCTIEDPPAEQAANERAHVRKCATLLGATVSPPAQRVTNAAREERMARHLDALRREGSVVAVVGWGHVDALAALLDG